MSSIAPSAVSIQTSPQSVPSTPSWFGEVAIIAHHLTRLGLLETIAWQVRFARRRFGHYDTIDFVAILIGYTLSGEATLERFYDRLEPFATPFMALFGRNRLPHRCTLSRFLAAIDPPATQALRALFQQDLLARPLTQEGEHPGGLWDRGARAVARLRCRWNAASNTPASFTPHARFANRFSTLRGRLCSWLSRTQAWRSRSDTHNGSSSPYAAVDGHVWREREWRLPGRALGCARGHR